MARVRQIKMVVPRVEFEPDALRGLQIPFELFKRPLRVFRRDRSGIDSGAVLPEIIGHAFDGVDLPGLRGGFVEPVPARVMNMCIDDLHDSPRSS